MADCDHPLEQRNVYGNPDPSGDRIGGKFSGVATRLKMDAVCERCGEKVNVEYRLARS